MPTSTPNVFDADGGVEYTEDATLHQGGKFQESERNEKRAEEDATRSSGEQLGFGSRVSSFLLIEWCHQFLLATDCTACL